MARSRFSGWVNAVAALALAALVAAPRARGQEKEIELSEVPKPVMDAVKAKFPGAELREASTEKEEGETLYEVSMTHKRHKMDVSFKAGGPLVLVETELPQSEVPGAVLASVKEKHPDAEIKLVESVKKGPELKEQADYYEFHLKLADGRKAELEVDAGGKILKTEVSKAAAPKKEDEDED